MKPALVIALLACAALSGCSPGKAAAPALPPTAAAPAESVSAGKAPSAASPAAALAATSKEIADHAAAAAGKAAPPAAKSSLPVELDFLFRSRPSASLPEDYGIGALQSFPSGEIDADACRALFISLMADLEAGKALDDHIAKGYAGEIRRATAALKGQRQRFVRVGAVKGDAEERRFAFKVALQGDDEWTGECAARKQEGEWLVVDFAAEAGKAPSGYDPETYRFD